jgi:hypothetical protein
MKRSLIGIKDAEDIDGVSGFIDGKHDQERKPLHRFTANIFAPDGRTITPHPSMLVTRLDCAQFKVCADGKREEIKSSF